MFRETKIICVAIFALFHGLEVNPQYLWSLSVHLSGHCSPHSAATCLWDPDLHTADSLLCALYHVFSF